MPSAGWVLPDIQSPGNYDGQSIIDNVDLQGAYDLAQGTGVVSGCVVTQDTGSDMAVAVGAGVVSVGWQQYAVAATGGSPLTVQPSGSYDRKDIVVYTVGTGLQVIEGTPCSVANWNRNSDALGPAKPAIPASSVYLSEVYVVAGATAITTAADIVQKQPLLAIPPGFILDYLEYAPGTATSDPIPTSYGAIDATNLTLSIISPPSGKAHLKAQVTVLGNAAVGSTSFVIGWCDHGTTTPATQSFNIEMAQSGLADYYMVLTFEARVTGMTPGTSYQFDLAGLSSGANDFTIESEANAGTTSAYGPSILQATAA
jgi:hypothetical protein